MRVRVSPSRIEEGARIEASPSKSYAHRLLICAALSKDRTRISNIGRILEAEDIKATIGALRKLGSRIVPDGEDAGIIEPLQILKGLQEAGKAGVVCGGKEKIVIDCKESGSTLRFLIPLCAMIKAARRSSVSYDSGSFEIYLTGEGRLLDRPLGYLSKLVELTEGLEIVSTGEEGSDSLTETEVKSERVKALKITGELHSGLHEVDGSLSSQVISGLLFALPLLDGDSLIKLYQPIESRPYINMTIEILQRFGVKVGWIDSETIEIHGNHRYSLTKRGAELRVEGDWSNAAPLIALGACVQGLNDDSLQGDRICTEYFKKIMEQGEMLTLDVADCPDLGPILMAQAALHGGVILTGTRRLRFKESDRAEAMREELSKCGIEVVIEENKITVLPHFGSPEPPEASLTSCEYFDSHSDHRIAMAMAVVAAECGGVIDGAEAVNKSFPDFWDKLIEAGVKVEFLR